MHIKVHLTWYSLKEEFSFITLPAVYLVRHSLKRNVGADEHLCQVLPKLNIGDLVRSESRITSDLKASALQL